LKNLKSGKVIETLEKEISFRQAIEKSLPSGIAVVDDTGKQVYVNQTFCNLVGWSENELLEKYSPHVYWSQQDIDNINNAFQQTLSHKAPKEGFDLVFCHKTGYLIPVNVIISAFIQENNKTFWLANVIDITERKQAEQALKESEEKLRISENDFKRAQTIAHIGHWKWYLKTNEVVWSDEMFNIFGIDKNLYTGRLGDVIAKVIHPDDLHIVLPSNANEFAEKKPMEYRIILPDKSIRYIWAETGETIFDENRKPLFLNGIAQDITEQKQTEQALKESEARFTAFMNNLPVSAFIKDKFGRNIYFNNHLINLMGFNNWENKLNDELIPDNVAIKVNEDDRIALEGNIHSFTEEMKGADGVVRIFHTIKFPIFTENKGTMLGGISVDITERKEIEQALKESETRFKEIINQINDGIVVFNEQGKIVIFNKGAEQIFDLKAEDVLNSSIVDIQYQFAPTQFKDKTLIENVINGIVTLQTPEVFNKIINNETAINSGKIVNLQSIVFPIKLDNYNLFCSVFRDTTEIKQYEKQLIQLNADKDRFITILAHDLKNSFNSILGFLSLLATNIRIYDIDKIEKQILIINKSAKNTYDLLEDILLWVRANSGKIPFEPQNQDFSCIFNYVTENLKQTANNKSIKINQFALEGIKIFADTNMLNTILRNLISNAIKFTNSGGTIDIYAITNHSKVTITISDNGIGINRDKLAKLFDISQVYTTKGTADESGTGLGLLLCKDFVEKHGCKIWVESEVGKGSDFKFTMPLCHD